MELNKMIELEDWSLSESGSHSLNEWIEDLIQLRDKYKGKEIDVFLDGDTIMIYGNKDVN